MKHQHRQVETLEARVNGDAPELNSYASRPQTQSSGRRCRDSFLQRLCSRYRSISAWSATFGIASPLALAFTLAAPNAFSQDKVSDDNDKGVQWGSLFAQSALFLGIEHGFRIATEPGTRTGLKGPFVHGWYDSLTNLHGWADGDPFLVNFVGHPMQGAVAEYIWIQNDRRYRKVQFGDGRDYWRSRLRAAAFSWAYSSQFELGPLSEASLGKIQNSYPQQGFVDHVATPSVGFLWTLAEDVLDRYVVQAVERRTANPWTRLFVRGGLNPSRSFANVLRFRPPWYRDSRPLLGPYQPTPQREPSRAEQERTDRPASRFSAGTTLARLDHAGTKTNCVGGGAEFDLTVSSKLGLVGEVDGCKLFLGEGNISGDAMAFLAGPRLRLGRSRRWEPFVNVLAGAQRITTHQHELSSLPSPSSPLTNEQHDQIVQVRQTNGFMLRSDAGVDLVLHPALALRLGHVRVGHAWMFREPGSPDTITIQASVGIVLRMGTW